MMLTAKERHLMRHGVLTASNDAIHIIRDLVGSENKRSKYWYSLYEEMQLRIKVRISGNPVTFDEYKKKWRLRDFS